MRIVLDGEELQPGSVIMNILAINCGSSTLKFQLLRALANQVGRVAWARLAGGVVDRIGSRGTIDFRMKHGSYIREDAEIADHGEAVLRLLAWIK